MYEDKYETYIYLVSRTTVHSLQKF